MKSPARFGAFSPNRVITLKSSRPLLKPFPIPTWARTRIGIDTGAYYGGTLSCLVQDGESRAVLQI